jgi:hypothetical protein
VTLCWRANTNKLPRFSNKQSTCFNPLFYLAGVVVDGTGDYGMVKEMGPMSEQLAGDQTIRAVAANSNFDQAWWEKYFPAFKHEWHYLLDNRVYHH